MRDEAFSRKLSQGLRKPYVIISLLIFRSLFDGKNGLQHMSQRKRTLLSEIDPLSGQGLLSVRIIDRSQCSTFNEVYSGVATLNLDNGALLTYQES